MHIIQLTDLHLSIAGECPYEIDVRENFLQALDEIQVLKPDLLVISGDLCYDVGLTEIYIWIKQQLDKLPFPYYVIPGNHDDTQLMIDCFGLKNTSKDGQLFYKLDGLPQPTLFLDTQNYTLPDLQLEWLATQLSNFKKPLCLFMHHPPVPMGVPFMDQNHALRNSEAVLNLLLAYPFPITIFTGHYHVDKSARLKNLDIHITPSTFFQIDWTKEAFAVDHKNCAFRSIHLKKDKIDHAVIYYQKP